MQLLQLLQTPSEHSNIDAQYTQSGLYQCWVGQTVVRSENCSRKET